MEKKTTIRVPEAYVPLLEDIRLLTADQNNPNRTTVKQQEQIWRSLQKYGWAYPIITNKDGTYADGEQRAEVQHSFHIVQKRILNYLNVKVYILHLNHKTRLCRSKLKLENIAILIT